VEYKVWFVFECVVNALFEGLVDVEFSLIDAVLGDFSVGGIAEMCVSEVVEFHVIVCGCISLRRHRR